MFSMISAVLWPVVLFFSGYFFYDVWIGGLLTYEGLEGNIVKFALPVLSIIFYDHMQERYNYNYNPVTTATSWGYAGWAGSCSALFGIAAAYYATA